MGLLAFLAMQLTMNKGNTPDTLTLRLHQDPFDPDSPLTVAAMVWAVDGTLLGSHAIHLKGLEQDLIDSIVESVVQTWRFGAPDSQLGHTMRYWHRLAKQHRKAHGG